MYIYIYIYIKQWYKMSGTLSEVIFIEHCDDRVCAHFTAFIEPPAAFLILRKRSEVV